MIILKTRSEVKVTVTRKWFVTLGHSEMHLNTKFGIPISKNKEICTDSMQFLETRSGVKFKVTVTQLWYATLPHLRMHPQTKFEIPTSKNIGDMHQTRKRDGQTDIVNTIKTKSEVKVTVTRKWYATLCHPKMHPHIKFGIPTSKNIGDMHQTRKRDGQTDIVITIKTKSEVKVTVTRKWYATLHHLKMHPHTKFGIPTSKNIGDMHRTRSGTDGRCDYYMPPKVPLGA